MIRTNRGNPCVIIEVIAGTWVRVRFRYGGGERVLHLSDLRADGGQAELDAALTLDGTEILGDEA